MDADRIRLLYRRDFLVRTGFALGAAVLGAHLPPARSLGVSSSPFTFGGWDAVRDQFALARDVIHMACFFLASHPRPCG